jgi:hypothetical protein
MGDEPNQFLVGLKIIGAVIVMGLSIWLILHAVGK